MNNPTKVLIVDDEDVIRQMVGRVLKYMAIESESAENGFQALEKLKTGRYDIIIADIRMPNMDGMELLKIAGKEYPQIDVIIMTAHSAKYSFVDVVEAGAADFINKPFSVEELKAKMERVMRERAVMKELIGKSAQLEQAYLDLLAAKDEVARLGNVANHEKDFLQGEIERLKQDNARLRIKGGKKGSGKPAT